MNIIKTKIKLIRQLKMFIYEKYYNLYIIQDEKGVELLKVIESINKQINNLVERMK